MKIYNSTQNNTLADDAKVADNFFSRSVGLLSRKSISDGEALVIKIEEGAQFDQQNQRHKGEKCDGDEFIANGKRFVHRSLKGEIWVYQRPYLTFFISNLLAFDQFGLFVIANFVDVLESDRDFLLEAEVIPDGAKG